MAYLPSTHRPPVYDVRMLVGGGSSGYVGYDGGGSSGYCMLGMMVVEVVGLLVAACADMGMEEAGVVGFMVMAICLVVLVKRCGGSRWF